MALTGRHYVRRVEVFPTFEGGELGRRDITHPRKAGNFTATNMLVNFRGHLIPRPGLKKINPTGLVNGVVQGFGSTPVPGHDVWFIQGTAVRTFASGGGGAVSTAAATLAATPTLPADWTGAGNQIYFVINQPTGAQPNGGVYQLNPINAPPILTRFTNSLTARSITLYNDRLVLGDIYDSSGGNTNQIRWNGLTAGVSDFTVWDLVTGGFLPIGDPWVVTSVDWQRGHLLIAKQNQWHILTNAVGSGLEVVRKASSAPGPLFPYANSLDSKDTAWYQDLAATYPSDFDGTTATFYRDIEYPSVNISGVDQLPPLMGVVPLANKSDGAVFISNSGSASLVNDVWTKHTFGVTVSGFASPGGAAGPNFGSAQVLICDGGSAGATPNFYVWNPTADTPGIEGGAFMRAGDDSATPIAGSVTFPEWWSNNLAEVQVRAVVVDFTAYNNGTAVNDHFDLTLNTLRRYESGDLLSSTLSFDSAPTNFSATGTRQRKIFGFNDAGLGNGFSMQFTNVKGVEIERVEVVLEDHPVRMGT